MCVFFVVVVLFCFFFGGGISSTFAVAEYKSLYHLNWLSNWFLTLSDHFVFHFLNKLES